jgi:hypothetical protein
MSNENNPNPIPEAPPLQAENPQPSAPLQATPPPAAALVLNGDVTDERVLAAERRAMDAERRAEEAESARRTAEIVAAEKQRDAEEISRKYNEKRRGKKWWYPVIGADEEVED